jgi:SAM-dependent methyltransferase
MQVVPDPDALDLDRLLVDHQYLRDRLVADLPRCASELQARRYPFVPREFVLRYLEHLRREHLENPQAVRYIEAELGAPGRQAQLLDWLATSGHPVKDRSCIDVGCNNGSLALACAAAGARRVVGVDVSEQRLETARDLCRGTPIDLRNLDILEERLEERFEVVLCTDVLEHVPDPAKMIRALGRILKPGPGCFGFVSVHNKLHPATVRSEPHYGVPGLVLLPYERAARLWLQLRDRCRSKLDYEVFHWNTGGEYVEMARAAGLRVSPLGGGRRALAAVPAMRDYARTFDELEEGVERDLAAAPLTEDERAELREAVAGYLVRARQEHASCIARPTRAGYRRLWLTYHCQPLVLVLRWPVWRRWLGGAR